MASWSRQTGWIPERVPYVPLREPLPTARPRSAEDEEDLRQKSERAAPRRIVLLAANEPDAAVEAVLAEPPAHEVHERIRQLAEAHRGRMIAAEWFGATGWVRWAWIAEKGAGDGIP